MKNIEPIMHQYFRKSLTFFIILLFIQFSMGRDTLSTGQTLESDKCLVSSGKTFALGFFRPTEMSKNRYLGIWYYKVPEKRIVWVANRDNPVKDTSGVVSFQLSNNLVIYGHNLKTPIWSTSFVDQVKNYSAQLLDTGNLIVFEEDKKEVIAWQSFDHPTNTWLPKMKIGVNRKTGLSRSLTSWKSVDDPGIGDYSFRMDYIRDFSELSLYRGPDRTWRTGPLNGEAQLISDSNIKFTYVGNQDEAYLMYDIYNSDVYSIMVVSQNGYVVMVISQPGTPQWQQLWMAPEIFCDNYGFCGLSGNCVFTRTQPVSNCFCLPGSEAKSPRDWNLGNYSEGCVRKRDRTDCRNGEGFAKLSGTKMPDTATARMDKIEGLKECEEVCLRDCNCTAYANVPEMGNACVMWYGDLMDTKQYGKGGIDLFVRVDVNGSKYEVKDLFSSTLVVVVYVFVKLGTY